VSPFLIAGTKLFLRSLDERREGARTRESEDERGENGAFQFAGRRKHMGDVRLASSGER
jgi:hypothetical protein